MTPRGSLGTVLGMCISPDQMSNEELERSIAGLSKRLTDDAFSMYHDYYRRRIAAYEALLKERAESGEYVDH